MPTNLAASVRARLLAKAKVLGENFDFVLRRYGVECVLRRLAQSPARDRFVLKGAMLFVAWTGRISRPTRDLDFLGVGAADADHLRETFRELCGMDVPDGIDFADGHFAIEPISEAGEYGGVRLRFEGRLDGARVPVQVDIGFGDDVVPGPEVVEFPSLIGFPGIRVQAYPREAMVAEKLHAIVTLGDGNSRMKDFHDIIHISETHSFDGSRLSQALAATFRRRATVVLAATTSAPPFYADPVRSSRWQAFHSKLETPAVPSEFGEVGERVRRFLEPVMEAVEHGGAFDKQWPPGGPWA
ncbi:MAG TPA: nucleotidyl transferase AbiEii/AbiGii toxin family protein [Vicinamibacterales bacterium]|nr:nucleotidyl transferase AbiEii/AbiGii toxin family protein [Vicinamibacterales bacterium]